MAVRIKGIIVLVMIFVSVSAIVNADTFSKAIPKYDNEILTEITGNLGFSDLVYDIINGETSPPRDIVKRLVYLIAGDVKKLVGYIISVMGFVILSACVKGAHIKLGEGVTDISFYVCYFVVSAFLMGILSGSVDLALEAAEEITVFIKMSLPAYIGIITSMGINAAATQGLFLFMVNVVSEYAGKFMITAFFYIGILTIVSNMSSEIKITKLIHIARQILFWVLGFLLTVFAGMTALSGLSVSISSATGIRAAKYTIGHAIPIVGGFLADSTELIFASAKIFKNAFGTAGIVLISLVCLVPVAKLFLVGFILKITSGLTEPFCDKLMSDSIYGIGQTIIHIMVAVLLMTVMFILAFAVLLNI